MEVEMEIVFAVVWPMYMGGGTSTAMVLKAVKERRVMGATIKSGPPVLEKVTVKLQLDSVLEMLKVSICLLGVRVNERGLKVVVPPQEGVTITGLEVYTRDACTWNE